MSLAEKLIVAAVALAIVVPLGVRLVRRRLRGAPLEKGDGLLTPPTTPSPGS